MCLDMYAVLQTLQASEWTIAAGDQFHVRRPPGITRLGLKDQPLQPSGEDSITATWVTQDGSCAAPGKMVSWLVARASLHGALVRPHSPRVGDTMMMMTPDGL
jgi:hypothetical protein